MKKGFGFECSSCGSLYPKWQGMCGQCKQWNSIDVVKEKQLKSQKVISAYTLSDIDEKKIESFKTYNMEIDNVLGGGFAKTSINLIAGEPGIGKSTFILSTLKSIYQNRKDLKTLYISGEESKEQLKQRTLRLAFCEENFLISTNTEVEEINKLLKEIEPDLLVIDSIQTIKLTESSSKEALINLLDRLRESCVTSIVIGQVTKDSKIAGPKYLEHMVDNVLVIEGIKESNIRSFRAIKNRFGSTQNIAMLEMNERGLKPAKLESPFLEKRCSKIGLTFSCIKRGNRFLFFEVQSIVMGNKYSHGKRFVQGVDASRVTMLAAVIERYLHIPLSGKDLYTNLLSGIRFSDPNLDLSIVFSLLSSCWKIKIPENTIIIGEVDILGEIRKSSKMKLDLDYLKLMGVKNIICSSEEMYQSNDFISVKKVSTLEDIKKVLQNLRHQQHQESPPV